MFTSEIILEKLKLKAKMFRGFSDLSRLKILELLQNGALNVSQIIKSTQLSQPNVSSHLRCLKECQLVTSKRVGREVYYELTDPQINNLLAMTEEILMSVYKGITDCVNYEI